MAEAVEKPPAKTKTRFRIMPLGVPDGRGWAAIGLYALDVMVLLMIREQPQLLESAAFMQIAGPLLGAGGLGLILAFHFGSSSGTANANRRADDAEKRAAAAGAEPIDPKKDAKP